MNTLHSPHWSISSQAWPVKYYPAADWPVVVNRFPFNIFRIYLKLLDKNKELDASCLVRYSPRPRSRPSWPKINHKTYCYIDRQHFNIQHICIKMFRAQHWHGARGQRREGGREGGGGGYPWEGSGGRRWWMEVFINYAKYGGGGAHSSVTILMNYLISANISALSGPILYNLGQHHDRLRYKWHHHHYYNCAPSCHHNSPRLSGASSHPRSVCQHYEEDSSVFWVRFTGSVYTVKVWQVLLVEILIIGDWSTLSTPARLASLLTKLVSVLPS